MNRKEKQGKNGLIERWREEKRDYIVKRNDGYDSLPLITKWTLNVSSLASSSFIDVRGTEEGREREGWRGEGRRGRSKMGWPETILVEDRREGELLNWKPTDTGPYSKCWRDEGRREMGRRGGGEEGEEGMDGGEGGVRGEVDSSSRKKDRARRKREREIYW